MEYEMVVIILIFKHAHMYQASINLLVVSGSAVI